MPLHVSGKSRISSNALSVKIHPTMATMATGFAQTSGEIWSDDGAKIPKSAPHPHCCGLRLENLEHRVSFRLRPFSKVLLLVILCELITEWMLKFNFLDPWAMATGAKCGGNPTLQMQGGVWAQKFRNPVAPLYAYGPPT
jgi:hypothetical protein